MTIHPWGGSPARHAALLAAAVLLAGPTANAQGGLEAPGDTALTSALAALTGQPMQVSAGGVVSGVKSGYNQLKTVSNYAQGGLALVNAVQAIRQLAQNGTQGCDYIGYLQVAQNVGSALGSFPGLSGATNKFDRTTLPGADYFAKFINRMRSSADVQSADLEMKSTVAQLEKVCQATLQLDQNKVIHAVVFSGDKGVGEVIETLFSQTKLVTWLTAGGDTTKALERYLAFYDRANPLTSLPQDTMHAQVNRALRRAMRKSGTVLASLAQLDSVTNDLQEDFYLKATRDTTRAGHWICPPGYPNPDSTSLPTSRGEKTRGHPVCGPGLPEQVTATLARTEVYLNQLQALEMDVSGAELDLGAIRLFGQNLERREMLHMLTKKAVVGF